MPFKGEVNKEKDRFLHMYVPTEIHKKNMLTFVKYTF